MRTLLRGIEALFLLLFFALPSAAEVCRQPDRPDFDAWRENTGCAASLLAGQFLANNPSSWRSGLKNLRDITDHDAQKLFESHRGDFSDLTENQRSAALSSWKEETLKAVAATLAAEGGRMRLAVEPPLEPASTPAAAPALAAIGPLASLGLSAVSAGGASSDPPATRSPVPTRTPAAAQAKPPAKKQPTLSDGTPVPPTAKGAQSVILDVAKQYPALAGAFPTEKAAADAQVELLRRMIWQLNQDGFKAGRQKNPSGAISDDKLTILINGRWHAYDVFGGSKAAGKAPSIQFLEVRPPHYVADPGIANDGTAQPPNPGPGGDTLDLHEATILNNPPNLADWPITTTITKLEMRPNGIHVEFSKRDGPGSWPDVPIPGWNGGAIQYTLGMAVKIGGKWYASAPIQLWKGLDASGGEPANYAKNWFYDANRWAPMTGHQPAVGEQIGIFVVAGNVRNILDGGSQSAVRERSNVVLVPMPSSSGAVFTPGGGATPPVPPPAPPSAPPPTTGASLDLHDAAIFNNPPKLADWPITTTITKLEIRPDGIHVEFSKRDGAGSWPDITPPGWDGALQYTLGMALKIDGKWCASAPIQLWRGLDASGGPPGQYAMNWFYDRSRWGPMTGHQPAQGEEIGFFVVAGNVRNITDDGSQSPVHERSNVVVVPMPGSGGATFRF